MTTETETAIEPTAPPKPAAAPKAKWTPPDPLTGAITRDGVTLCRYVDGVILWESEELKTQFTAPVHKALKAENHEVKAAIVSPSTQSTSLTVDSSAPYTSPPGGVTPDPAVSYQPSSAGVDPMASLNNRQRQAVLRLRRAQGYPDAIEPRTKKPVKPDKLVGVKSEKYALDLLRFDPAAFVTTYGVVGIGKVVKSEKRIDPETKVEKKYRKEIEAVLSKSKCHLTERAEGPHVVTEDSDDE